MLFRSRGVADQGETLAREPAARYANAGEMLAALRAAMAVPLVVL